MIRVKIAGIYKISVGEFYYIGKSVSILDRWMSHVTGLVMGKHHSPELQNKFDIYGLGLFKFEIIEVCSLSEYKFDSKLKGKQLESSFNKYLLEKEKKHMNSYSINFCLNKDKKYFQ
jgi:hypothetical protein